MPAFDRRVSEPIRVARVLCIFFMIYVHVNPGFAEFDIPGHGIRAFDLFRFGLVNSVGRASVALLSAISGYLAAHSLVRLGASKLMARRFRSLIVPLAIWNAAFILLTVLGDHVRPGYLETTLAGPLSLWRLPTLLVSAFAAPANVPLGFLRDTFVCAAMMPLLLVLLRRHIGFFLAAVVAIFLVAQFVPLLITADLILFFAIGIWCAERGRVPMAFPVPVLWMSAGLLIVLGAVVTSLQFTQFTDPTAERAVLIKAVFSTIRFPAAVIFWSASVWLSRQASGRWLSGLEPYMFMAFCTHMILLTPLWFIWQSVFGDYYGAAYPVFFMLAPFVVFAGAVMVAESLFAVSPALFGILNGGRLLDAAVRRPGSSTASMPTA